MLRFFPRGSRERTVAGEKQPSSPDIDPRIKQLSRISSEHVGKQCSRGDNGSRKAWRGHGKICNLLTEGRSLRVGMLLCSQMRLWHMHEPVPLDLPSYAHGPLPRFRPTRSFSPCPVPFVFSVYPLLPVVCGDSDLSPAATPRLSANS